LIYLLDTNVISELREPRARRPDPSVLRWFRGVSPASFYLSVVTVMELELGILQLKRRDPARAAVLRAWLNDHVLIVFAGRILPVDIEIAQRAAALHSPTRIAELDEFIAATAFVHQMTVVTRNISHFAPTGVSTLNPWEA
jgi:predicted nucleic acid-binding protein